MIYKTEHITDLGSSQTLLAELFTFVGENYDPNAQLRDSWAHFFRVWADQDPYSKIRVFTAREEGKLKGCVMALLVANPLFVAKPFVVKFVELTNEDKAFAEYVDVVLASL